MAARMITMAAEAASVTSSLSSDDMANEEEARG